MFEVNAKAAALGEYKAKYNQSSAAAQAGLQGITWLQPAFLPEIVGGTPVVWPTRCDKQEVKSYP